MPDIIIEPAATATSNFMRQSMNGRDAVDIGAKRYVFFITDSGLNLKYRLSLDEGATYGAAVNIYTDATDPIKKASIHFDQWTRNDVGTVITIWLLAGGAGGPHKEVYRLDTTTDVLTGPFNFLPNNPGSVSGTVGWVGGGRSALGVTKSEDGRFHAVGWIDNGLTDGFHAVSTDGIVWDDTTHQSLQDATPTEGNSAIKVLLVPDNDGDDGDIWAILMDEAPQVLVRKYDFSTLTWGAQNAVQGIATNSDVYFQMAVCQYFATRNYFLVFWTDFDIATADYQCYELESSTVFTLRTAVLTNFDFTFGAAIQVDQSNGDLYGAHFNGLPESVVSVFQDVNVTGGVGAWVRTQYDEGVADDMRWLAMPPSGSTSGSRFMPAWRNDDLDDIISNFDTSIELGDTPIPPPVPVPPPPIVPPGGTYDPAAGAVPGSIVYLTPPPESRAYPLVTPHHTGRFVMSFSGMGTPDIQYITQRGPNQDGETLRDFNLTPRVVQLLERQQFVDRDAWWAGRATILDELRPNRQVTATGVATGILRMVKSDGSIRDLNVLVESGPRFEARNVNEWDEWAFEEVLRFIAFDPLFFDPTRVDFAMPFVLDVDLVFPITFPITFGSGLIDVSLNLDYTGTWASLPTIVIVGPLDNPIIDNVTTGETLDLRRNVGPGETVTIDLAFGQKTITNNLGANLLGSLSTDSDLGTWHIAPTPEAPQVVGQPRPTGRNVIRLRGSNPTGSTSVQVRYHTRYFGI